MSDIKNIMTMGAKVVASSDFRYAVDSMMFYTCYAPSKNEFAYMRSNYTDEMNAIMDIREYDLMAFHLVSIVHGNFEDTQDIIEIVEYVAAQLRFAVEGRYEDDIFNN